jgi:P63C domain
LLAYIASKKPIGVLALDSNDSKIGSAGGIARAKKLSDERKREIARNAALARHTPAPEAGPSPDGLPRATHQGRMALGDLELDCYVLSDGRRVFHKRGMAKALGLKSAGGNAFMKTISRKGVGSNISSKLREKIENPIKFKPLSQEQAHGYEAAVLAEIARAIVDARDSGSLTTAQESFAAQAEILLNAFAKVGVVALVDEATGYQEIRDPGALRLLVQQYIEQEKREWEKQFPDSYYDELNRLYGSKRMTQTSRGAVIQNRPQHFAKFTRTYVYHPLENGAVLEELDRINPILESTGTRAARFHQHLTQGYGIEKLKRQVQEVQTLVAVSDTVSQFKKLFQKRFPREFDQRELLDE